MLHGQWPTIFSRSSAVLILLNIQYTLNIFSGGDGFEKDKGLQIFSH